MVKVHLAGVEGANILLRAIPIVRESARGHITIGVLNI